MLFLSLTLSLGRKLGDLSVIGSSKTTKTCPQVPGRNSKAFALLSPISVRTHNVCYNFSMNSYILASVFFVLFYFPFISSIHEKANCIAILWTGSPHSLGSCLSRGLWATCLPHKGGGIPLSALPKDTTSELAGLFSTTSHKCRAPSREAIDTIFKSLLV